MAHLGCTGHTAAIVDRNGATVCPADVLTGVEWSRLLDETAPASVTFAPSGDCCQKAANIRTWWHRLVIWRGDHPVFDGPVTFVEWNADAVIVQAKDVSAILDRRLPHQDQTYSNQELCFVASQLLDDALLPGDNVDVEIVGTSGVYGDRFYETDVGLVLDHLRDLSDTGIDWTCAGARILLMGDSFAEVVGSLSDRDFPGGLKVVEDGGGLVNRWVMWIDGGRMKAEASESSALLLEGVHDSRAPQDEGAGSIRDLASAQSAVEAQLALTRQAPVFIDTGEGLLAPDANVDVGALVPGYCLQIASTATCRTVASIQKVYEVRVSETGEGEQARVLCAPGPT